MGQEILRYLVPTLLMDTSELELSKPLIGVITSKLIFEVK